MSIGLMVLWCDPAFAIGPGSQLRIAQIRYDNAAPSRSTALERLAWELDKRTSVSVAAKPIALSLRDPRLFRYPLLFMSGDKAFALPPAPERRRLREFLVYGGFLLIDSAEAKPSGGFDRSVRALLARLFPKQALKRISAKHTLHKSFYLLNSAVGRTAATSYWEGIERDGRMLVVYSRNDLAGAWARDNLGQWEYTVHPGGDAQRELAFRWGINIVMYALCIDYKADQVHIPFILKRRRWQVFP